MEGNTKPPFVKGSYQLRRGCFVLNNWTQTELDKLVTFAKVRGCSYIYAKEIGESGTPHIQGYINFGKRVSFNVLRKLSPRAHWEKCKGSEKQNVDYCRKDGDYETNIKIKLSAKELQAKIDKDILAGEYDNVQWREWQRGLLQRLRGVPDKRKIIWFWERTGNVGKSYLAKYIDIQYNAVLCEGKSADVNNQVVKFLEEYQRAPTIIIADIPRSSAKFINYGCIEKIKNGHCYSGMFYSLITLKKLLCVCEP